MTDFEKAERLFNSLKDNAQNLFSLTERSETNPPLSPKAKEEYLLGLAKQSYEYAIAAVLDAHKALHILCDKDKRRRVVHDISESASGVGTEVEFDTEDNLFKCKIFSPPIMKSKRTTQQFFDLICLDLEREIVETVPDDFAKFRFAYVIFVNYFQDDLPPNKQPYFDNDNLAIKGILDAIVPYLCFDDATKFCDNIYISQPTTEPAYTEIHVIPKEKLGVWFLKNSHLDLAKNATFRPELDRVF